MQPLDYVVYATLPAVQADAGGDAAGTMGGSQHGGKRGSKGGKGEGAGGAKEAYKDLTHAPEHRLDICCARLLHKSMPQLQQLLRQQQQAAEPDAASFLEEYLSLEI